MSPRWRLCVGIAMGLMSIPSGVNSTALSVHGDQYGAWLCATLAVVMAVQAGVLISSLLED